ncbi:MAG: tetratricopeptide repeat protein [Gemmatimonadetes bacterium]|nr:tetratricopeptide repeat protein [Gemmatimonadota bacterium]
MSMRSFLAMLSLSVLVAGSALAQGVSPESAEKYNAGQELYKKRQYQKALEAFEEAVKLDPKNAQAYRAMGKTYQKLRNYKKAIEAYQMATSIKTDYAAAYFEMGELQLQATQDYTGAQASMRKVLSIDPNFADGKARDRLKVAYLKEGTTLFRRRNYKAAAAQYESATQVDPSDATVFYNLGLAHRSARSVNAAREALETAIELNPNYGKAHRGLGDLFRATGKNSSAARAYLKAIQADAKDTRSRLSLAVVYQAMKQNSKAISVLSKAAQVDPKNADVHKALGNAYSNGRQYTNAVAAYKRALGIKNTAEVNYRIAEPYFGLKQYQNAIRHANRALSSSEWRVAANVILGDCYRELGQKERAIAHYKKGVTNRQYKKYCEDQIDRILNPMGGGEEEAQ